MYQQVKYVDMVVGAVYRCPPGGQVMLVLDKERHRATCYLTFLVLASEGNEYWRGKEGTAVREHWGNYDYGSWTRVA